MADVDWIKELKTNAPDSERAFLKEVLCFLKHCPISDDFQKSLDTDFPATRGLLEEQVTIGMKDAWDCADYWEGYPIYAEEVVTAFGNEDIPDWYDYHKIVLKTGFYWIDTASDGYQNYYALFYYDAESKEAVVVHNTGGRSEYGDEPYFKTSLKYRLATGMDARITIPAFLEGKYASLENKHDRGLRLYYLGRKCESEETAPPLGIFNWVW